jgi:predicted Rossmann fold nucleotide-binding protein DprA/Smf involved in DNA uptake
MAKQDRELLDRLRAAGLRKQVARPLSAVGADARKRAVKAARAAIDELRALADELERRLPADSTPASTSEPASGNGATSSGRSSGTRATAPPARAAAGKEAGASSPGSAAGEKRAAIVRALGNGPMTASEVAAETGISVSSASSTLARMAKAGELVKAPRGYALPG